MSYNLITSFSFEDEIIQQHLFKDQTDKFEIEPSPELDFTKTEISFTPSFSSVNTQNVLFSVNELWQSFQLTQDVIPVKIIMETNNVTVIKSQQIEFNISYCLFVSNKNSFDINQALKKIFTTDLYDFLKLKNQTFQDFKNWVSSKIQGNISEDSFIIKNSFFIKKIGNPIDVDIQQRNTLLRLFGILGGVQKNHFDIIGPDDRNTMQDWASETRCGIEKIGEELTISPNTPNYPNITEVPGPKTTAEIENIAVNGVNAILQNAFPPDCGIMVPYNRKLLTLAIWPEFKITWTPFIIKIGCIDITLYLPVLQIRISELVFYLYYSLPKNTGSTILKIAENCAIRSAISASVVSLIICNPELAGSLFEEEFKKCLEEDIKKCVNPGLYLVKVCGNWS